MQRQPAPRSIFDILHPGAETATNPHFRDAPFGWTPAFAESLASVEKLTLTEDHWEVIRVLQGCYKDEVSPRIRLLRDALLARFADRGGMKYLFAILPGGPIAQGCTLAGLKPPYGARDLSFGSVA
jgi:TusE/DsrC/DsvC family sulfur relay protein